MMFKVNTMNNEYLHIEGEYCSYCDGVFSGYVTLESCDFEDFCLSQAEEMRHSDLGNYDKLTKKQREEVAKRWEAAKDLSVGEYDYYFNLEDKYKVFKESVEAFAQRLGIKYKLELIGNKTK